MPTGLSVPPVGGVDHGRCHRVGDLPADPPGQVVGEGDPGLLEVHRHREGPGLGEVHDDRLEHGADQQRVEVRLEVHEQGGTVERRPVVEHDPGAQVDGPGAVGGVRDDRLGEIGGPAPVGQDDGERVEDGTGVHDAHLVEAGSRRVEALLLGVDPEDQAPALDRLLHADPVAAGPVGPDGEGVTAAEQRVARRAGRDHPRRGGRTAGEERPSVDRTSHVVLPCHRIVPPEPPTAPSVAVTLPRRVGSKGAAGSGSPGRWPVAGRPW